MSSSLHASEVDFDKPHWRTILTTGDKAEAEALDDGPGWREGSGRGDRVEGEEGLKARDGPLKMAGARWAGGVGVKGAGRAEHVRRGAQMADLSGQRYGVIAEGRQPARRRTQWVG